MKRLAMRSFARSIRSRPVSRLLPWAIDRIAAGTAPRNHRGASIVVVAATGHGNIGDQAMLEAVTQAVPPQEILVVGETQGAFGGIEKFIDVAVIPGLLNGSGLKRLRAHRQFASLTTVATEVVVIGADLMDGLYNPRKSIARLSLLRTSLSRGAGARVTGFSWPPHAAPVTKGPIKRLSDGGATFFLRDPVSFERFKLDVGADSPGARLTADVVFTDSRRETLPPTIDNWLTETVGRGQEIAVVNVSGLIEKRLPQTEEYREIFDRLREENTAILVLPHVVREEDGDSEVARKLFAALGNENDFLVGETLTPSQVRELTSRARIVITGRMHLAIMALSGGTPAITLATQGKVEGLYSMFNLPALAVEPKDGFGSEIAKAIRVVTSGEVHEAIRSALPDVRARAELNFDGLKRATAVPDSPE